MQDDKSTPPQATTHKQSSLFVDQVLNISISPNGACRIHFVSWQTDQHGQQCRLDSELIMTIKTVQSLATNLPKALSQANQTLKRNKAKSASSPAVPPSVTQ